MDNIIRVRVHIYYPCGDLAFIVPTLIIMAFFLDQDCAGSVTTAVHDQAVSLVHCTVQLL